MFKSFFIIFCLIIALSAWALSAKVPPINSTWVEGHWVTVESQKVWVPGYWKDPNEKPEKQLESEKDPVKENKVIYIQQPVVQETKVVYVQQPTQQVIYVQQPQSTFMSGMCYGNGGFYNGFYGNGMSLSLSYGTSSVCHSNFAPHCR